MGVLSAIGVSAVFATPSNFIEATDTNIRFNNVGTFDWANSGPNRTVTSGVVSVDGTGGIFNGGTQGANNSTPPTPPTLTAAAASNTQIVDADFIVDPLSSDNTACGSGDPSTFAGAGSETNGGLISSFTFGTSGNTPPKNDLSNVYALSRDGDSRSEIFFGAERVVNNGDSHIDFEFLQSEVTVNATSTAGGIPCAGTLSGDRTQGDLLLAVDFTNGGTFGGRTLYMWQCDKVYNAANDNMPCNPPATGKSVPHYEPVTSGAVASSLVFGVNSQGAIPGGGWTHRNSDGSPRTDVITNAFMEGAIDLTALGFDGCVQTLLPHTRSSQSFTAVLKDFSVVRFNSCREPEITTQVMNTNGDAADTEVENGGSAFVGDVLYDTAELSNATATAGGTVDYYVEKDDDECTTEGATHLGQQTVTDGVVPDSDTFEITGPGTYYFWAVYSGDAKNAGDTSACDSELVVVVLEEPTVATQVMNTNGDAADSEVDDDASVTIPSTLYDTAELTGATATAGGTATYYVQKQAALEGDAVCDTDDLVNTTNLGTFDVTDGDIPDSNTIVLSSVGRYEFWVEYSGDPNNVGTSSTCGDETVLVSPNTPSAATVLMNTNGDDPDSEISDGTTISIPSTLYDTASLTGATADAGGTATYYVQKQAALEGDAVCDPDDLVNTVNLGTFDVTDGDIPDSNTIVLSSVGRYEFWVEYSGDSNNVADSSDCGDETVIVQANAPTATTILMNTNGTDPDTVIGDGGEVSIPSTLYDTAFLLGETDDAGGTATYYVQKQAALDGATVCDPDDLVNTTNLGTFDVTDGDIPDSNTIVLSSVGRYEFWVEYSGDANNQADSSACGDETVIVVPNTPTASTLLKNTNGDDPDTDLPDGSIVTIPTTLYDTASLTGETADAGGTATYYYQKQAAGQTGNCDDGIQLGDPVSVTAGWIPDSTTLPLSSAGTYEFWVVYSGDDNNLADTSECGDETVVVAPNSPQFTTQPEVQIRDVISLSGLTADATGSVTIELFDPTNLTCDSEGTAPALSLDLDIESDGTLSNGTWSFETAYTGAAIDGVWKWQIGYGGDANNAVATSACGVESVDIDITPDPS